MAKTVIEVIGGVSELVIADNDDERPGLSPEQIAEFKHDAALGTLPLELTMSEAARTLQLVAGHDDALAQAVEAKLDQLMGH